MTEQQEQLTDPRTVLQQRFPRYVKRLLWGVECYDGWLPIIAELFQQIAEREQLQPELVTILQVKQKFGSLRVYLTPAEPYADLVAAAEKKAAHTCEICGAPGTLCRTKNGWWETVCSMHADERKMLSIKEVYGDGDDD